MRCAAKLNLSPPPPRQTRAPETNIQILATRNSSGSEGRDAAPKVYPPGQDINVGMLWSHELQQVSYAVHCMLPAGTHLHADDFDMSDQIWQQVQLGKVQRKKAYDTLRSACAGF